MGNENGTRVIGPRIGEGSTTCPPRKPADLRLRMDQALIATAAMNAAPTRVSILPFDRPGVNAEFAASVERATRHKHPRG